MTKRIPIPDFVCGPFGLVYNVDKNRTNLANKYISCFYFYNNVNPKKSTSNENLRIPPNFVCDSSGTAFCLKKKRMKLVKTFIYLISILINFSADSQEEFTTSHTPDHRIAHNCKHLHHRPIIHRQFSSKTWLIAILLKLLLVAWDLWTYRIGFQAETLQFHW